MIVEAEVQMTRYSVVNNRLVETVTTPKIGFKITEAVGEKWLHFDRGYESMPLARVPEAIEAGGWCANAGAPPVCVNGKWGGHVYSKIVVPAESLKILLKELR